MRAARIGLRWPKSGEASTPVSAPLYAVSGLHQECVTRPAKGGTAVPWFRPHQTPRQAQLLRRALSDRSVAKEPSCALSFGTRSGRSQARRATSDLASRCARRTERRQSEGERETRRRRFVLRPSAAAPPSSNAFIAPLRIAAFRLPMRRAPWSSVSRRCGVDLDRALSPASVEQSITPIAPFCRRTRRNRPPSLLPPGATRRPPQALRCSLQSDSVRLRSERACARTLSRASSAAL